MLLLKKIKKVKANGNLLEIYFDIKEENPLKSFKIMEDSFSGDPIVFG